MRTYLIAHTVKQPPRKRGLFGWVGAEESGRGTRFGVWGENPTTGGVAQAAIRASSPRAARAQFEDRHPERKITHIGIKGKG